MPIITLPVVGIKGCKIRIIHFTLIDETSTGIYCDELYVYNITCRTTATQCLYREIQSKTPQVNQNGILKHAQVTVKKGRKKKREKQKTENRK